jgi:hypothetical protein
MIDFSKKTHYRWNLLKTKFRFLIMNKTVICGKIKYNKFVHD